MDPGSDTMLSDSQLNGELESTSDCSNSDSGKDSSTDLLDLMNDDHTCQLCEAQLSQPRILSCLHVYCTGCLEKQVEDCNEGNDAASAEEAAANAEGAAGTKMGIIQCIVCKQNSLLPPEGVQGLPLDSVLAMVVDKSDSDDGQILCTSCKAQEKAVAQCSDCATFLCPGCVTAHQFMRCFENHKVIITVVNVWSGMLHLYLTFLYRGWGALNYFPHGFSFRVTLLCNFRNYSKTSGFTLCGKIFDCWSRYNRKRP